MTVGDTRGIVEHPVDPRWGGPDDGLLHVVLVEPEIPPNTGSIARLCAGTASWLHLVRPLGFELADRHLKRAGLDYWPAVGLTVHDGWDAVAEIFGGERLHLFSTHARTRFTEARYRPGDALVFGCESRGLSPTITEAHPERGRRIPVRADSIRSLNLANAVSVAVYEALRQRSFAPIDGAHPLADSGRGILVGKLSAQRGAHENSEEGRNLPGSDLRGARDGGD